MNLPAFNKQAARKQVIVPAINAVQLTQDIDVSQLNVTIVGAPSTTIPAGWWVINEGGVLKVFDNDTFTNTFSVV